MFFSFTNNANAALSSDDLTAIANFFYRSSYLHNIIRKFVLIRY